MTSPFPGMDPYIEASGVWEDFHHDMISDIKRALARTAPERYIVRATERSYLVLVEAEGKTEHAFAPDVTVSTERRKRGGKGKGAATLAEPVGEVEPITMRAFVEEEHREAFVEIFEATPDQRLVTCIEVLSPSNKRRGSTGWELYLRKRQSLMLEGVNLIEIDLLRGGHRMPMLDPWPSSPYTILVSRARKHQLCRVWPASYRRRLPVIPVPLDKPDADLSLDLQPIIDDIYERSRYGQTIDYQSPLTPPLSDEDAAWIQEQVRARQTKR